MYFSASTSFTQANLTASLYVSYTATKLIRKNKRIQKIVNLPVKEVCLPRSEFLLGLLQAESPWASDAPSEPQGLYQGDSSSICPLGFV